MRQLLIAIVIIAISMVIGMVVRQRTESPAVTSTTPDQVELVTITLSIDTQDKPLETYNEIVVEPEQTLPDVISAVFDSLSRDIAFAADTGHIEYIDTYVTSQDDRTWVIYQNGIAVNSPLVYELQHGDYIELQYERTSQVATIPADEDAAAGS